MFILLNGSFGIGKTTAAKLFVDQIPGAYLYNPEEIGFLLRRLPAFMLGLAKQPEDYQDLALWRRLIPLGARLRHKRSPIVVVPMSFTNLTYLDDFAASLEVAGPVHRLCLVAPLDVVRERLAARASREGRAITAFELRRSAECVDAHHDPVFGTPIDAAKAPTEIVREIRASTGV